MRTSANLRPSLWNVEHGKSAPCPVAADSKQRGQYTHSLGRLLGYAFYPFEIVALVCTPLRRTEVHNVRACLIPPMIAFITHAFLQCMTMRSRFTTLGKMAKVCPDGWSFGPQYRRSQNPGSTVFYVYSLRPNLNLKQDAFENMFFCNAKSWPRHTTYAPVTPIYGQANLPSKFPGRKISTDMSAWGKFCPGSYGEIPNSLGLGEKVVYLRCICSPIGQLLFQRPKRTFRVERIPYMSVVHSVDHKGGPHVRRCCLLLSVSIAGKGGGCGLSQSRARSIAHA